MTVRDPMTLFGIGFLGLALFWTLRSGWRPSVGMPSRPGTRMRGVNRRRVTRGIGLLEVLLLVGMVGLASVSRDPVVLVGLSLVLLAAYWSLRSGWRPSIPSVPRVSRPSVPAISMPSGRGRRAPARGLLEVVQWGLMGALIGGTIAAAGIQPVAMLSLAVVVTPAVRTLSVRPTMSDEGGGNTW